MIRSLDCIPCLVRQSLDAARLVAADPALHERMVRDALALIGAEGFDRPAPWVARAVHRRLRTLTGVDDPYREVKARTTRAALALLPECRARIAAAADPFEAAVRMAIAGNVIDFGVEGSVGDADIRRALEAALEAPLAGEPAALRRAIEGAGSVLYLADNAGEIVFDRPLIERIGPGRVTLAVRGGPAINDATRADASAAGIDGLVEVIDNGVDAPGTLLAECAPEFLRRFAAADLVLAKGQGNYETLCDAPRPVFFLFKVKCAVIANRVGLPRGTHVIARAGAGKCAPVKGGAA